MGLRRDVAAVVLAGAAAGVGFGVVGCSQQMGAPGVMHPLMNDREIRGGPRERLSLDAGWRFQKGDPAGLAADAYAYDSIKEVLNRTGVELRKPGSASTLSAPKGDAVPDAAWAEGGFNDASWRAVDLPHDWVIEQPFDKSLAGPTGRLPYSGAVWYRKHVALDGSDAGKTISLDVDGAMSYALVWVNGKFAGGWPYGYSSFRIDLTPFVKAGGDNVIAIRLDTPDRASRWYPGGGMYRNVWLTKTSPVHVAHWGTAVTTPEVAAKAAKVHVRVGVDDDFGGGSQVTLHHAIYALNGAGMKTGEALATGDSSEVAVNGVGNTTVEADLTLPSPKLWDLDHPQNRYVLTTTVMQGGKAVDVYDSPFGVRTVEFDPSEGLLLNGKHVLIQGVCDHHDLGAIGSAVNVRALQRQLEELKEMGCNAIRTSHNPPTPELLDLADQMGFMVMDETFDCWEKGKNPGDYHLFYPDWHDKDTRALVRRDRNHPSVIIWSVGNEVPDQGDAGTHLAKELTEICHQEDPSRPTGSANNNAQSGFNTFHTGLDVMGINYNPNLYQRFHDTTAGQFVFGSETASTVSTRGFYTFPVAANPGAVSMGGGGGGPRGGRRGGAGAASAPATAAAPVVAAAPRVLPGQNGKDFQVSAFDLYYPSWAQSPDTEFAALDKAPFMGGEFVWTGFDYLGEPTPFGNRGDTARSSYFGIIDLAGFKKDRFYEYQAHWRPDFPMAHILPHWNWPDRVGQVTPVHIYTSGDEAELFLNGKSLGRKKKGQYEYRIRFDDVVYAPGELHVVAYKNGKPWAEETVKTTGEAAKLAATPDHATIAADGKDLSYVTVAVDDAANLNVPTATNAIHFTVSGPGELVATDNGDATDLSLFKNPDRKAFAGLALAIIRATGPGTITVKAESAGLSVGSATISAVK